MNRAPKYVPMPLGRRREPFDHVEWLFELKYNGFRAMVSVGVERPEFIFRKANAFPRFSNLALFIYPRYRKLSHARRPAERYENERKAYPEFGRVALSEP
jgi:hypothetical protein